METYIYNRNNQLAIEGLHNKHSKLVINPYNKNDDKDASCILLEKQDGWTCNSNGITSLALRKRN